MRAARYDPKKKKKIPLIKKLNTVTSIRAGRYNDMIDIVINEVMIHYSERSWYCYAFLIDSFFFFPKNDYNQKNDYTLYSCLLNFCVFKAVQFLFKKSVLFFSPFLFAVLFWLHMNLKISHF